MKKQLYDDSWMYILLLSTLVILTESIKKYSITILNVPITLSIVLIPLTLIITNYLTKKYDYRKTIFAIIISTLSLIGFLFITSFAIGKEFLIEPIIGDILAYIMMQIVNLLICYFLLLKIKPNTIIVYGCYLLSLIVFYMTYTLVNLNNMSLDNYWKIYLIIMFIQAIISMPLAIIDKYIKKR